MALPRTELLRTHAAIAHVLHLSGALKMLAILRNEDRDRDDRRAGAVGGGTRGRGTSSGEYFMEQVVGGRRWEIAELSSAVAEMFAGSTGPTG